jgi:hypothetical protein
VKEVFNMGEVKTDIIKLTEGEPHVASADDYLITENHTISDILRWLVNDVCGGDKSDIEFMLREYP